MRRLHGACLVLLAMFILAACGKPAVESAKELPKPPLDPWSWVPPDGSFVGRVALSDLRKTELWPLWAEVEQEQHIDAWVPLDKVTHVTFGGTGQSVENLSYIAALEGGFSLLELSTLAKQDQTPRERHGLLTFYRRPDSMWTQVDEKLIIVCTPDRVQQVADRAIAGQGTPVKDAPLYKALAERIALPLSHVAIMAEDPEGKGKAVLDQQAERYGLGSFTADAKRLGFSVEIGADYRVVAVAETPDEQRAEALQTATKEKLAVVSNNMIVRMLGLGGMVGRLRVSGDENFVFVRGTVPEVDFNAAVDRLHRMMSVAKGPAHVSRPRPDEADAAEDGDSEDE